MESRINLVKERVMMRVLQSYEKATLKYRTRNARIKFWWTKAAPTAFCMGAAAEWWKWTYQDKYRTFRLEGGVTMRPSAYEVEMYRHYLEKHGTDVMETDYASPVDPQVQFVMDTIIKENVK